MQMSTAEKQAFVNALDQAKRTVHPDLVICTRRYIHKDIYYIIPVILYGLDYNKTNA